jgi:AcrR family transcriptional regulator
LNAIARDAGVNVVTLHRHFPTKDGLLAAVLDAILEPLATARDRALAAAPGEGALATFVHEAVRLQGHQPGLIPALGQQPASHEVDEQLRRPAIDIVTPLVERAHRDGELRGDLDEVDVLIVAGCGGYARTDRAARDRPARGAHVTNGASARRNTGSD